MEQSNLKRIADAYDTSYTSLPEAKLLQICWLADI